MDNFFYIENILLADFLKKEILSSLNNPDINWVLSIETLSLLVKMFDSENHQLIDTHFILNYSHHIEEAFGQFLAAAEKNPNRIMPSLSLEIEPCLKPYRLLNSLNKLDQNDVFFNNFDDPYGLLKSLIHPKILIVHIDEKSQIVVILKVSKVQQDSYAGKIEISLRQEINKNTLLFGWKIFCQTLLLEKNDEKIFQYKTYQLKILL